MHTTTQEQPETVIPIIPRKDVKCMNNIYILGYGHYLNKDVIRNEFGITDPYGTHTRTPGWKLTWKPQSSPRTVSLANGTAYIGTVMELGIEEDTTSFFDSIAIRVPHDTITKINESPRYKGITLTPDISTRDNGDVFIAVTPRHEYTADHAVIDKKYFTDVARHYAEWNINTDSIMDSWCDSGLDVIDLS